MRKPNVIIVGAGLFGSVAATLARKRGHNVTVIDCGMPDAASKASGCVIAPSWLSSLSKLQINASLDILNQLYSVEQLTFSKGLGLTFKASRVPTQDILVTPDLIARVSEIEEGAVRTECGKTLKGKVLVAAGIWSAALVPTPKISGLYGCAILFENAQLQQPTLRLYAPYRQAVAINIDKNTVWFGDGTALIEKTWRKEAVVRKQATLDRAVQILGKKFVSSHKYKIVTGCRPYVEGHKAGYFNCVMKDVWVSTGGAKNGTILAAWQALQFVKEAL